MPKTTKSQKKPTARRNIAAIVGIDLGTTNSAVAILEARQPVLIPGSDGTTLLPSVVHLTPASQIVVGADAEAARIAMPSRTIAAAKRQMGSETLLRLGDNPLRAEEVSSFILKELKTRVHQYLKLDDEAAVEAVITVPAYFTDEQRRATKRAGELAGFTVERIINEPTAAALAFGLGRSDEERTILVYDLGGGTFDVSVVQMFEGIIEVQASKGNSHLGGEDFDWLIVQHLSDLVKNETGADPNSELRAKAQLKQQAEAAKKQLSFQESVEINIPLLMFYDGSPISLACTLERSALNNMIADHVEETMACVRHVLADSNLTADQVDDVLLVGGSTRIPLVQDSLRHFFGRQPLQDVNPDEAVALGAAVQAGIKSGEISPETLIATDVAPFSMGIAVAEQHEDGYTPGHFSVIIPRNTTIPAKRSERYLTVEHGQTSIAIEVYQGESPLVAENHPLGEFIFDGVPFNPNAQEAITVTFGYNLNGILEVEAQSLANGATMSVEIHDQIDRDSKTSFNESIKRLDALQKERQAQYQQEALPMDFDIATDPPQESPEDMEARLLDNLKEFFDLVSLRGNIAGDLQGMLRELQDTPNEALLRIGKQTLEELEMELRELPADTPSETRQTLKQLRRELRRALRNEDYANIVTYVFVRQSTAILLHELLDHEQEDDQ